MRNAQVFKKRYALLALLALTGYGVYWTSSFSPVNESVIHKARVNSLATLYIMEVDAGATTSHSYQFYIYDARKTDDEFKKSLDDQTPFFITSDEHALKKIENGIIYLSTKETVYQFRNRPSYRYNNGIHSVFVNLDASSYVQ